MTEHRFEYDEKLLEECADSALAAFVTTGNIMPKDTTTTTPHHHDGHHQSPSPVAASKQQRMLLKKDASCLVLFQQHAAHYGRHHAPKDELYERKNGDDDDDASMSSYHYVVGNRLRAFVQSVVFVHQHNSNINNNNNVDPNHHKVTLNRFSDLDMKDIILLLNKDDDMWDRYYPERQLRRNLEEEEKANKNNWFRDWVGREVGDEFLPQGWQSSNDDEYDDRVGVITRLSSSKMILHVAANLAIGKGSMNKLQPKKQDYKGGEEDFGPRKELRIPTHDHPDKFETPKEVEDPEMDGIIMSIKENKAPPVKDVEHHHQHKKQQQQQHHHHAEDFGELNDNEDVVPNADVPSPPQNTTSPPDQKQEEEGNEFASYLNWATTANPDGVPIVHCPFDQGTCGACWAFAAAGSLEASASRRAAYDAFMGYSSMFGVDGDDDDANANATSTSSLRAKAIAYAQQIEQQSFQMLNLSVQELVDCDTSADQGCTGGNPLLAFYFIHRYGLTSWDTYPYVGFEDECKAELVRHPIATVKSWGIISPNHESHIELVLRYLGPVAVGINGGETSFLAYQGGIFDKPHCKQGANHALLITGYGQEETQNGTTVRYWIARNSWGSGWGENGYVRVKRGDGHKGTLGVCGIARSPSIALGGILLSEKSRQQSSNDFGMVGEQKGDDEGPLKGLCASIRLRSNAACMRTTHWIDNHKAWSLGLMAVLFAILAAWPLTRDCRRRRRRRRQRELRQQQELERQQQQNNGQADLESSPLLGTSGDHHESYGAGQGGSESSPLLESR